MIRYFNEDIKFVLKQKLLNNRWLKTVAGSEMRRIGDINIIFCSDNYILDVNMKYLEKMPPLAVLLSVLQAKNDQPCDNKHHKGDADDDFSVHAYLPPSFCGR